MDLLRPPVLKELCARAGIRPDRKSGQNFLINRGTLERIVAAVDPQLTDTILEVGAGFGVLTLALAEHGARIIAIERDRRIVPMLREFVSPYGNVEVVEGDILALFKFILREPSDRRISLLHDAKILSSTTRVGEMLRRVAPQHTLKLAANLPYSITSDFLRLLFDRIADGSLPVPDRVVLLLQREVVDRLCADLGQQRDRPNVGMLTILAQLHCTLRRIARVPPAHFWPAPKVESAVVALERWRTPSEIETLLGGVPRETFLRLVRRCFAGRRKQLITSCKLQAASHKPLDRSETERLLRAIHVEPTARPETLTFDQWIALAQSMVRGDTGCL